jgi:hypothetical protein
LAQEQEKKDNLKKLGGAMLYLTIGLIVILIGVFAAYKFLPANKKGRLKPYFLIFSILVLVVLITEVSLTIGRGKKIEPTESESPALSEQKEVEPTQPESSALIEHKVVKSKQPESPRVSTLEKIETVPIDIQIKRAPSTATTSARWEKLSDRTIVLSWGNIKDTYQSDKSGLIKDVKMPTKGKVKYEVWHNGELEQEGSFDYYKANKQGVLEVLIQSPK